MAEARDDAYTRPLYDREAAPGPGTSRAGWDDAGRYPAHAGRGRRAAPQRIGRWRGTRSGGLGVLIVAAFALVGAAVTIATRRDPGPIIGGFVFAGTIAAGLIVAPRAAHVIIPVPALAYLVTAPIAGIIRDPAATSSRTGLLTSAAQWLAGGFLAMVIATAVAIAITAARRAHATHTGGHRSP